MNYRYFTCLFLVVFVISCKTQNTSQKNTEAAVVSTAYYLNTSALLEDVEILSSDAYEGRRTGTNGAALAQEYIVERFAQLGVHPLGSGYLQSFTFQAGKTYHAANVLALIPGTSNTKEYIILSAHYDHEGIQNGEIYNGADDDASGIAALIAFAEYFKENPPKHSVILAAVDAEELGLVGSKYFVENSIIPIENIKLNINMDMISRSDKNQLYAVGSKYYKHLEAPIKNTIPYGNLQLRIGHDGSDKLDDWTYASDHASFHKAGIPFIYFGVEDHKDYHQPTDDYKNIHPDFYKNAVHTILAVFQKLDTMQL
ncbi:M28 family peptidase [Lacinutrix sp. C3R15]|uniref:M28 family peptidase n=1 Tax=Flavobacteriaceae TaxID=49546 RepID=UPI001C08957E|nr:MULTISPECIES: M28 family peptidase [Flavobacteriaceae]MBU2940844.1 M28 family peptidase [Lacinutrix sp. C3R15]MDO6624162.1 M28 family peptidase [Oceanihabitans sp. 1_MG-2023]